MKHFKESKEKIKMQSHPVPINIIVWVKAGSACTACPQHDVDDILREVGKHLYCVLRKGYLKAFWWNLDLQFQFWFFKQKKNQTQTSPRSVVSVRGFPSWA